MMAEVEVLQPGLFSTIQDRGRFGFKKYGVPQGGAMDLRGSGMANLLLDNSLDAAVLEVTFQGPKLMFHNQVQIAITGAQLSPRLGDTELENSRIYQVEAGQVLSFGRRLTGYRAYVGVRGGFQTEQLLGSRSWSPGVTKNLRLEKGMRLPLLSTGREVSTGFSVVKRESYYESKVIEAFPGPEYHLLSASEKKRLQETSLSVGKDSNRMGIQFEQKLQNSLKPIVTGPVLPGTVQLTPSGTLIALMRDGQTTGGYPRVLQITETGMNILAQKMPGEVLLINIIDY